MAPIVHLCSASGYAGVELLKATLGTGSSKYSLFCDVIDRCK